MFWPTSWRSLTTSPLSKQKKILSDIPDHHLVTSAPHLTVPGFQRTSEHDFDFTQACSRQEMRPVQGKTTSFFFHGLQKGPFVWQICEEHFCIHFCHKHHKWNKQTKTYSRLMQGVSFHRPPWTSSILRFSSGQPDLKKWDSRVTACLDLTKNSLFKVLLCAFRVAFTSFIKRHSHWRQGDARDVMDFCP